jgi:hypothetical protein
MIAGDLLIRSCPRKPADSRDGANTFVYWFSSPLWTDEAPDTRFRSGSSSTAWKPGRSHHSPGRWHRSRGRAPHGPPGSRATSACTPIRRAVDTSGNARTA